MNSIETFFLNQGLTWTLSKSLPYLLCIFLGIIILYSFFKKKNSRLKKSLIILLSIVPFGIYFSIHPIYQGDFTKNGRQINQEIDVKNTTNLLVITIPNCPYCMGSIRELLILKKRNPKLNIEFLVCSKDSNSLVGYTAEAKNQFIVRLANDPKKMAQIAQGGFPAFVEVKNRKATYVWSNDQFGVRAKDMFEKLQLK